MDWANPNPARPYLEIFTVITSAKTFTSNKDTFIGSGFGHTILGEGDTIQSTTGDHQCPHQAWPLKNRPRLQIFHWKDHLLKTEIPLLPLYFRLNLISAHPSITHRWSLWKQMLGRQVSLQHRRVAQTSIIFSTSVMNFMSTNHLMFYYSLNVFSSNGSIFKNSHPWRGLRCFFWFCLTSYTLTSLELTGRDL